MTKSWRPEGWKYKRGDAMLYSDFQKGEMAKAGKLTPSEQALFEAGADAMLEALRANGQSNFQAFMRNCLYIAPESSIGKGKYLFIPDEE